MGPDPAPSKGKEKESPFQFYAYLGSVSFKPHHSQNSAPLLENNAVIKLLLRGQNISFSPVFRRTGHKPRAVTMVWTSPNHQISYRLLSYRLLNSCPSHLGLNILRKSRLPAHNHFWNSEGIKYKSQFVTGHGMTGGRIENTIIFLKLKFPDLKDFWYGTVTYQNTINWWHFSKLLIVTALS